MADRIRIEVVGDSDDLQAALRRSRESIKGVGDESDRQTTRAGRVFDRLRAKLAKPISAKVEADTAAADARLNDLGAKIKALDKAKASMTVDADVAKAESELRRLRAEMRRTADAGNIRAQARVDVQGLGMLELLRARLRSFGRENATASVGVSRLDTSVGGLNGKFMLLRNGMRLLRFPALIAGAGLATQAIGALSAGAVGLAGSLTGSLTVAAVGAGGAVMALGQGMGVWKLATGGISTALGGLNEKLADTKAQKAAFKGLSDEAKDFARDLEKMKPKILALQHVAQRGLLPGLREGLREAAKNLPVVERLIDRTSRALGDMAASAGKALGSAEWGRDIETIGTRNVAIMRNLGGAAGGVANALRHVAVVGGPVMERLSRDTRAFGRSLADAAARGRASGGMAAFFDRAYNSLKRTVRIARDFGAAVVNIGKIGTREMGPLGGSLERTAAAARRFTSSAAGSRKIGEWFRGSLPAVRELGRLVVGVGGSISRLGASPHLAPLIQQIRTQMLPAVEALLRVITAETGPAFVNLATQLARLFAALAPLIAPIVSLVANLAGALAGLIARSPGVGMLAAGFVTLGAAVSAVRFVGAITGLTTILSLIRGISTAAPAAAAGVGGIAARNAAVAGGGGLAAGAAGGAAGGGAMAALKKWGGRGLKFVGGRAILPVGIAITAAQGMQALGMQWFKPIENLKRAARLAFNALPRDAQRAFSRVGGQVVAGLRAVPGRIAGIFRPIPGRVAGLFRALPSRIAAIFRSIPGRARGFVIGFAKLAGTAVGRVITVFWRLGGRIVGAVRGIPGRVGRIFNGIGRFASRAVANVAGYFRRLPGRVVGAVRALPGRVGRLLTSISRFASRAVSDVGRRFASLTGRVLGAVRSLPGRVGRVFRSLVSPAGSAVANIVRAFASLPGKALRALGGLIGGMARLARDAARAFIRSLMGALPRKLRRFAGFATGGIAVGFAGGGTTDSGGTPTLMDKFAGAPTRKSTGGRHSRPTYLVGEENRPEFVIATNPAYRKANLEYLSMAAAALKAPMVPAFAKGGKTTRRSSKGLGSINAEDRANFQYANPTPRARPFRGQMRVRGPRGRWIEPLLYGLQAARERESFYEELGEKKRGGRSSREWYALSRPERYKINNYWESRSDRVGKLHEFWERRFESLNELWGQLTELRGERRGQAALGRRVQRGQLGVLSDFAGQYVGSFSRGTRGPISLPRSFGSSGIAEVHRGERVVPDPRGGYGSQVAVAGQGGPVKVDLTIGFDDRGMLKIVDQRIDGRAADVSSREIGRRTRRIASAPGARRPTYAR